MLEDFVIEDLSRLYVPMVRKELWTDDPEQLNRRFAVYATLWYVLKMMTVLFNPITPYLSETLYQNVYRRLSPNLPESVNFESWPKPDKKLRRKKLEEDFQTLFKTVSLVYSARQNSKLKRRWPLRRMAVVAPKEVCNTLKGLEDLFLELANVKTAEYTQQAPEHAKAREWASASEDSAQIFLDPHRDKALLGEGLMRDLARRIQALRKELGYMPTDVLEAVHVSELGEESIDLLQPYLKEMSELVRAENVFLHESRRQVEADWHKFQVDNEEVYVAIAQRRR
jgi:isoleucyl-tRNA synthetase